MRSVWRARPVVSICSVRRMNRSNRRPCDEPSSQVRRSSSLLEMPLPPSQRSSSLNASSMSSSLGGSAMPHRTVTPADGQTPMRYQC